MLKKENLPTDSYKGVRDFYPEDQALQRYMFATMREIVERFGYVEYHASILESAELYKAKGAENEELVNEQTYTFTDRGGREVTLRPEMTPTVARMVAARKRELGFPLRYYSIPNLFRYERPQRGRLREHWQLNVDIFGSRSAAADAEIIAVAHAILIAFGASQNDFSIRVGSRAFLDSLTQKLELTPEQAKMLRNLLDRRAKISEEEFKDGFKALGVELTDLSPDNAPSDIATVLSLLKEMGVENAEFDPGIVRGFDYYTGIVFEVFDKHPENNRAMLGGGRYDNLLSLFDNKESLSGVGFGMGDVTIQDFLRVRGFIPPYVPTTKVYVALAAPDIVQETFKLVGELRAQGVNVAMDFGEKRLSDQIKAATKHKIPYSMVVGQNEFASNQFTVRDLASGDEKKLSREELANFFLNL
jgi:histidyl-tRNA synthetase